MGVKGVGSGLPTVLWTSVIVTVMSRKITIVGHSPHILSTGRIRLPTPHQRPTFTRWEANVFLWTASAQDGEKAVERVLWMGDYSVCKRQSDINTTMWDEDADCTIFLSSKSISSPPLVGMEQRHQEFPSNAVEHWADVHLVKSNGTCLFAVMSRIIVIQCCPLW